MGSFGSYPYTGVDKGQPQARTGAVDEAVSEKLHCEVANCLVLVAQRLYRSIPGSIGPASVQTSQSVAADHGGRVGQDRIRSGTTVVSRRFARLSTAAARTLSDTSVRSIFAIGSA